MANVQARITCRVCGQEQVLVVDADAFTEYASGSGRHVQDLFPDLTPPQREMFISGTCGDCWNKIFPPDLDEEIEAAGAPGEAEAGRPVDWSNLPGSVKAAALNAGDHYRGCRWYRNPDGLYLAFRGDPGEWMGSIQADRLK